jgi:ribosome-associated translation inhibitor RaiA
MDEKTLNTIIDILKFALPTVLLPIFILWNNNQHNRKIKELEQKFELDKLEASKKLDTKHTVDNEKRTHEKDVYACLLKILFEVQKLYIELSGHCVDYKCIDTAVSSFKTSLTKYQEKISDNQIYLTPEATNQLYGFYQKIGDLLIELKEMQDKQKFHLAIASVYFRAKELAMITLLLRYSFEPQEKIAITEEKLVKEYSNFITCCGNAPSKPIVDEYKVFAPIEESLLNKLEEFESEKKIFGQHDN